MAPCGANGGEQIVTVRIDALDETLAALRVIAVPPMQDPAVVEGDQIPGAVIEDHLVARLLRFSGKATIAPVTAFLILEAGPQWRAKQVL